MDRGRQKIRGTTSGLLQFSRFAASCRAITRPAQYRAHPANSTKNTVQAAALRCIHMRTLSPFHHPGVLFAGSYHTTLPLHR